MKSIGQSIDLSVEKESLNVKTWEIFLILLILMLLNTWIFQSYIMTREVYVNLLSDRLEINRIDDYFSYVKTMSYWSYAIVPIILFIRVLLVSLIIQFPLVFKFIDISLKMIFRIVAVALIPIAFSGMIKNIWLLRLPPHVITEDTLNFVPFAVTTFINISHYSRASYLLLSNFNIFEVLWCCIAVMGLKSTGKIKYLDATILVLIVWTSILIFQWALVSYFTRVYY